MPTCGKLARVEKLTKVLLMETHMIRISLNAHLKHKTKKDKGNAFL